MRREGRRHMGRNALIVELPTKNKKLALYLVFSTDKASPRHYICGLPELVKKELDKYS